MTGIRLAAAAVAALVAVSGPAASQQFDAHGVMPSFNFQFVEPTLTWAGIPFERLETPNGGAILKMNVNGLVVLAEPTACKQETATCAGFLIVAVFEKQASVDLILQMNNTLTTVKVGNAGGVTGSYVQRYLIGDYGYVRGSFIVNMQVFAKAARMFQSQLYGNTNQISYDQQAALPSAPVEPGTKVLGDDFADDLNARQKSVLISGNASIPATAGEPSLHETAIGAALLSGDLGDYLNRRD